VSEGTPGGGPGQYAVGSVVAGYRLEQQIGYGGMAVVFRAHDPRLNRDVALKILAPNLAYDDAFRKRFIRESRAAAALDDPHVIPVFEAGETEGVLFIAMRFARGGDVRSLLDRAGPLPPARAVEIIAQAASALDSAHASGLVHRDVKPANMLLDSGTSGDRPDHVYLSDFGLSKVSLALTGLTASGQFLGTLEYTAPEQILGQQVDGRADQYGLACATLELFTGAPPFRRDQPMAMMYAHVNDPPPLLSELRPDLGDAADDVLNRALAKFPEDRYDTCREFAAALRQAFQLGAAEPGGWPAPAAFSGGPAGPPTQTASHPSQPPVTPGTAPGHGAPDSPIATSGPPTQTASHPSQPPATPGTAPGHGAPDSPIATSGPPAQTASHPSQPQLTPEPLAATQSPGHAAAQPGPPPAQSTAPAGPAGPSAGPPDHQPGAGWPAGPPAPPEPEPPVGPSVRAAWEPGPPQPARDPAGADTEPGDGGDTEPHGESPVEPGSGRRSWWRSPVMAAAASVVIVLGVAGGYFLAGRGGGPGAGKAGGSINGRLSSHRSHTHHRPTGPVAPGCSTTVPKLTPVIKVATRTIKVGPAPYALQHSTDGRYTFVTVSNGIAVFHNNGGLSLSLLRTVPLPGAGTGLETTTDGHYLIAADGSGAAVLSVSALEDGAAHPVLGMLTSPHGSGAATPMLSVDDQYLFVALTGSHSIAVFNFGLAVKSGFSATHFIGDIPAGVQPTGMRLAVDQNYLYATSLRRKPGNGPSEGTLSVINVPEAEKDPAKSVKVTVDAGCGPERIYPSQNTVWVTARDSNAILAFSASALLANPSHALLAVVPAGPAPVGVTPLTDGRIVITDSADGAARGGSGNVAIISGDSALAGKPSLLGVVPVAGEPYQLTRIENHNTLLVTNLATGRLVALNVTSLPS